MNKSTVLKGEGNGHSKWVVGRAGVPQERQLFSTRKEARLFCAIRNSAKSFSEAVSTYAGTI